LQLIASIETTQNEINAIIYREKYRGIFGKIREGILSDYEK